MTELKPCKCGMAAGIGGPRVWLDGDLCRVPSYQVYCDFCGRSTAYSDTAEGAIYEWTHAAERAARAAKGASHD